MKWKNYYIDGYIFSHTLRQSWINCRSLLEINKSNILNYWISTCRLSVQNKNMYIIVESKLGLYVLIHFLFCGSLSHSFVYCMHLEKNTVLTAFEKKLHFNFLNNNTFFITLPLPQLDLDYFVLRTKMLSNGHENAHDKVGIRP